MAGIDSAGQRSMTPMTTIGMSRSTTPLSVSRSATAPGMARERRAATQAFLHSTGTCKITSMRKLAFRCGAELSGNRAYDVLGNSPVELLAQMEHLAPHEKAQVKKQLTELPRLRSAADHARSLPASIATSQRTLYDARLEADTQTSGSTFLQPPAAGSRAGTPMPSLKEREQKSKTAMKMLGASASAPHLAIEAALARPRILQTPPDYASRTLKTIAATLRCEELAVRTIRRNPKLLERPVEQYQRVVPVLMGLLGGEEAAYALTVRPELLDVEQPQQIRETMQSLADCLHSQQDGAWLVNQTLAPPSIKVYSRAWCHEDLVGEYFRVRGARSSNRPVYKKPAQQMEHHKDHARDMFMVFASATSAGKSEDRWVITPVWDDKAARGSIRRPSLVSQKALGQNTSSRISPDQALGTWLLHDKDKQTWDPEPDFKVLDSGAKRGAGLLTVPTSRVRSAYNHLKEALGEYWMLEASGHSWTEAAGTARIIGNLRRSDHLFIGGEEHFKYVGDFGPAHGFGYLLTTPEARRHPLVLLAWEPVAVYLMYCRAPEAEVTEEEEDEEAKEQEAEYMKRLKDLGWLTAEDIGTGLRPPELSGQKPIAFVLTRGFVRGRVEIPAHEGSQDAPLIFVKPRLSARTPDFKPCQAAVVAKPGEPLFIADESEDSGEAAEGDEEGDKLPMRLEMVGEVGFAAGYLMVRPPQASVPCEPSDVQLVLDTEDPIKVVIAWFHVPEAPLDADPGAGTDEEEPPPPPSKVEPPPPPAWVETEGWKVLECKLPVVLKYGLDNQVTASYIYVKEFSPGEIAIHGSGEAIAMVSWQNTKDPRPGILHKLLIRRPSLLASGQNVTLLMRCLRIELGDAGARRVLMDFLEDWSAMCEICGSAEVEAWVYERKMEAFGAELRGVAQAKMLVQRESGLAHISAPVFSERCAVLREGLQMQDAAASRRNVLLDVTSRFPSLLLADVSLVRRSFAALRGSLGEQQVRRIAVERPRLLLLADLLEKMFAKLEAKFTQDLMLVRLKDPSKEWGRWPDMVEQGEQEIGAWIGRIVAEERASGCQQRVRDLGTIGTRLAP